MIPLLFFFLSGAAAWACEVLWAFQLAVTFGGEMRATGATLALFLSGIAFGGWFFGRKASEIERPLHAFGLMHVAVGGYGLLFATLTLGADALYASWGAGLLGNASALGWLRAGLGACLLLIPTTMMGGMLPVMGEWMKRRGLSPGAGSTGLYAAGVLGGAVGVIFAGFGLAALSDIRTALWLVGGMNLVSGAASLLLATQPGWNPPSRLRLATREGGVLADVEGFDVGAYAVVALAGALAVGFAVLSARAVAMLFGAALASGVTTLAALLCGVGLGSAVAASALGRRRVSVLLSCAALIGAAVWITAAAFLLEDLPSIHEWMESGLARTSTGHVYHQGLMLAVSLALVGVPSLLLGAVFPSWMRHASGAEEGFGARVGRLFFWSVAGGGAGSFLAGFLLLPGFGLRGAMVFVALVAGVGALGLALRERRPNWVTASAAVLFLGLVTALQGGGGWREGMSAGLAPAREVGRDGDRHPEQPRGKIELYEDAPGATVTVDREARVGSRSRWVVRANGGMDVSVPDEIPLRRLLAHLALGARPGAREVFLQGFGGGIAARSVLGHPVDRLTIAEVSGAVIRGAAGLDEWNRGVLGEARTRLLTQEARTVLKLEPVRYDVILSQPPGPWTAEMGGCFSWDFYDLAAQRLNEGGIFAQMVPLEWMDDPGMEMVLRTFARVFPNMEVWDAGPRGVILIGSGKPWRSGAAGCREMFGRGDVRSELKDLGISSAETLWARQLASQRTAPAIAREGALQSDTFPALEAAGSRAFFTGEGATFLEYLDERTWQMPLASEAKRRSLAALNESELRSVFEGEGTMNPGLKTMVTWRVANPAHFQSLDWLTDLRLMPFMFREPTRALPRVTFPDGASDRFKRLTLGCIALQTNPAGWRDTCRGMLQELEALRTEPMTGPWPVKPKVFGAHAARACLRGGDLEMASAFIRLEPHLLPPEPSPHLGHLARIVGQRTAAAPPDDETEGPGVIVAPVKDTEREPPKTSRRKPAPR